MMTKERRVKDLDLLRQIQEIETKEGKISNIAKLAAQLGADDPAGIVTLYRINEDAAGDELLQRFKVGKEITRTLRDNYLTTRRKFSLHNSISITKDRNVSVFYLRTDNRLGKAPQGWNVRYPDKGKDSKEPFILIAIDKDKVDHFERDVKCFCKTIGDILKKSSINSRRLEQYDEEDLPKIALAIEWSWDRMERRV